MVSQKEREGKQVKYRFSKKQAVHLKKKRQNKILSRGVIIAILAFFLCCLGILGQAFRISYLNQQVVTLEREVDALRSENDTKQGKLTESQNDTEIKAIARSYGMKEATPSQKITETVTKQNPNEEETESNDWYRRLFK